MHNLRYSTVIRCSSYFIDIDNGQNMLNRMILRKLAANLEFKIVVFNWKKKTSLQTNETFRTHVCLCDSKLLLETSVIEIK